MVYMPLGEGFYLETRGARLWVYDSASRRSYSGPTTVFLLHGSPGQASNWKHVAPLLEQRFRVVVYELRGYGRSSKPPRVSLGDYLEDQDAVMEALGVSGGDAVLVGHSFGGLVAQEYAARRRVKALVLVSSLARLEPDLLDRVVWSLPPLLWRRLLFTENPLTRRLYRKVFFSDSTPDEVYEEFVADNKEYLESLPPHVFRYLKYFSGYDASRSAPRIDAPTLIIVGGDDSVTPPAQSRALHGMIRCSTLRVVPGAGHMILYEKPALLAEEIAGFIESPPRCNV